MLNKEDNVAIKFNVGVLNGQAFLAKIGVPKAAIASVAAKGWSVSLTGKEITFQKGVEGFAVPVDIGLLGHIQGGALTLAEKVKVDALKYGVEKTIGIIVAKSTPVYNEDGTLAGAQPQAAVLDEEAKKAGFTFTQTLTGNKALPKASGEVYPTDKMKQGSCVKLADATKLYQPVFGSSAGSRYYVIGVSKGLRIAARYTNGSLSVRVEGPEFAQHNNALTLAGFDVHTPAKGYASLHLAVGTDQVLASKTLGAVLLGLGVPFDTPVPELKIIKAAS